MKCTKSVVVFVVDDMITQEKIHNLLFNLGGGGGGGEGGNCQSSQSSC